MKKKKWLVTNDYVFFLPGRRHALPGSVIEATDDEVAGQEFKLQVITTEDEQNAVPPRRRRGRPPNAFRERRDMVPARDAVSAPAADYETKQ